MMCMCGNCGKMGPYNDLVETKKADQISDAKYKELLVMNDFVYMACAECGSNLIFVQEVDENKIESPVMTDPTSQSVDSNNEVVEVNQSSTEQEELMRTPRRKRVLYKCMCPRCNVEHESKQQGTEVTRERPGGYLRCPECMKAR